MRLRATLAGVGAATLLSILAPTSFAQLEGYELTAGIPSDFFLVTGSRQNPEQDFLEDHWSDVHGAFMDSGILEDVLDMLASEADPEAIAHMEAVYDRMSALTSAVDWDALGAEVVFGERLNTPLISGKSIGIGVPDMIFLFKLDEQHVQQTYGALLGLGQGTLGEIQGMTGIPLAFEPVEEHGIQFHELDFTQLDPSAPDFPISIGHTNGAIAMTIGKGVRSEVAALLAGAGDARSIRSTARFQAAFEGLPAGEDGFEYVDMQNLERGLGDMFTMITEVVAAELLPAESTGENGEAGPPSEEAMIFGLVEQGMDMLLEAIALTEYSVTVHHTEGYSVHSQTRSVLSANAQDNHFYPLIGMTRPVSDFARYLPVTTSAYTVQGATDLAAVYGFTLDTVAEFGPMGQQVLGMWEGIQAETGFDMQRDVISWIDGETVQADFTVDGKDAWVTRMRVKDEAMANEKMAMGLAMIPELLEAAAEEFPMAMMLGIEVQPCRDERYPGFSTIQILMAGESILCGVKDGWMVFGSSADAIATTEATAAGELPNALENAALMADALRPEGAVEVATFSNYVGMAEGMADMLSGITMVGGMVTSMIEEPEAREVAVQVIRMLGKLAPVVREIDFYRSGSATSSFDGHTWTVHSVTNYAGPDAPAPTTRPVSPTDPR